MGSGRKDISRKEKKMKDPIPFLLTRAASDDVGFQSYGFRAGAFILCLGAALYIFLKKRNDR